MPWIRVCEIFHFVGQILVFKINDEKGEYFKEYNVYEKCVMCCFLSETYLLTLKMNCVFKNHTFINHNGKHFIVKYSYMIVNGLKEFQN